eukprot:SAG11_NODE_8953_length_959_cov_1.303488_2_plen_97_part_01
MAHNMYEISSKLNKGQADVHKHVRRVGKLSKGLLVQEALRYTKAAAPKPRPTNPSPWGFFSIFNCANCNDDAAEEVPELYRPKSLRSVIKQNRKMME